MIFFHYFSHKSENLISVLRRVKLTNSAQMSALLFENIDFHLTQKIHLDESVFYFLGKSQFY